MQQFFEALGEQITDHWIKFLTGLLIMAAGWILGQWRARARWQRKEFLDRLNISLNSIQDGTLRIRTISEKSCRDIFLNDVAVRVITNTSQKTTARDPLLPIGKDDYWYYLNAVLNEVAELFHQGTVRRDCGLPVSTFRYLICLTSECAGELKTRKVRAMLIRRELLEKLPEKPPQFESPHHITRWETLNIMATQLKSHPWRFMEVEVCV